MVLGVHTRDSGVGADHVAHRKQTDGVDEVEAAVGCDVAEDLVVLVDGVRVPEQRGRRLRRSACATRRPAHRLHFVDGGCIFGAPDRRRSRRTELIGAREHERLHRRHPRCLCRLRRRRRSKHPRPRGCGATPKAVRDRCVATVTEAARDQLVGRGCADGDAGQSRLLGQLCQRHVQVVRVGGHQ